MKFDSKYLWDYGGYSEDNPYEIFLCRVRREAKDRGVSKEKLEKILLSFFLEVSQEPRKYMTAGHVCEQCECGIANSGTNATHYICKKIEEIQNEQIAVDQGIFSKKLDKKITKCVKSCIRWYEIPTFKKLFKFLFRKKNGC